MTPETVEYLDLSSDYVVLTIPIMNSDDESIRRIKRRLSTFFQLDINNTDLETTNLITVPLSIINFSTLGKCITPFKLKAVSYTSNEVGRREFIVFMRNIFSTKKSDLKLEGFLSTMKKSKSGFDPPFQNYFSVIKDDSVFEDYLTTKIFKTKNVETDETYDVTGRAFGSLFGEEWLHCDIIDSYLNEWRRRVGDVISNPSNGSETRVKIFNTLLYTRLTRGVVIDSLKALPKSKFLRIQENAKRIAKEKVYRLSKVCTSIFDFDILIIPIHIDDHWMTGVIYQPRNCLTEIKENDDNSMEIDDDSHSSVFVFDSLATNFTPNKHLCTAILKEYVAACFSSLKEKFLGKDWLFEKDKIRTVRLKCPYQQRNSHDCGLYMLEFIRQIMVNPGSLELLIRSEPMVEVLPNFCVSLSRNYLKSFVYSKVELEKWIALYEMEEYFLTDGNGRKVKDRRSRSVESKRSGNNVKQYIRRKSCEIFRDFVYESSI
uniref:ULP_PROTEASE domain-containing protein n=1 Tax=Strongyloides papillosus TaxID=174720 RepID=A0A0N5B3L2_STREA